LPSFDRGPTEGAAFAIHETATDHLPLDRTVTPARPAAGTWDERNSMASLTVYGGLFLAAFVAATILPMQSEAALVALLLADYPPLLLVAVASVGNVAGSVVNWLLGRGVERFRHRPWFPASPVRLAKAERWYRRYGRWSLLMSWLPVVGDPLTVLAGVLREPFPVFLLLVSIAKVGRYLALAGATLGFAKLL
jgi:membrane protein YqaA with SNARE-associated domain